MVVTEQRNSASGSRAHAPGRGVVQSACERNTRLGELTDLQRNSQPPVPSVSKCAHFQLASLLLICTKSNLAESARCYASLAGRSNGPSLFVPPGCCLITKACPCNHNHVQ